MIQDVAEFDDRETVLPTPANVKAERNRLNGVAREESFEHARPVQKNDPTYSLEAEENLLSSIFVDPKDVLGQCRSRSLEPAAFYDPKHALIYGCMQRLHAQGTEINPAIVAVELKANGDLDRIGGFPFILQVSNQAATTAQSAFFIDRVMDLARRRELLRVANRLSTGAANPHEDITELSEDILARIRKTEIRHTAAPARPITDFTYPKDDDPDILLGSDDYLGRGGGMLFVSHAGAGKSSWVMDACMSWSLGDPWCGISAKRPLKILIIQGEDSDRYIGKVVSSFIHARVLGHEQQAVLRTNCKIHRLKGVSGPSFFAAVRPLIQAEKPDIVVINPLYIYAEGDIGRSEYAQPFLSGLDLLNKEEKFAYILVHHTGKPAAKTNGKRAEVEDWESVYMGFGSSYLANWPRCSALLEPLPNAPGRYVIKLGKAGYNAGVTKKVPQGAGFRHEPTTRIPIRHSTDRMLVNDRDRPVYFWEEDDGEAPAEAAAAKTGRPPKYEFSEFSSSFPTKKEEPIRLAELHRRVNQNVPIKQNALYNLVQRFVKDGSVEMVDERGKTRAYRLAV